MDNYNGFPDDPSTPVMLAAGVDYRLWPHIIVGAVISTATPRSSFSTTGNFTDDEIAGSIYAGYRDDRWWGNAIATYGYLNFAVNRDVPVGISVQQNKGTTFGADWGLATEGGYKFRAGWFTHGPVVGITLQRATVDDFTEAGSFTSLAFGTQTRNSAVSALGYRASVDWGAWRPFAQVVWNHELANTDRGVTAYLTTSTLAPGYTMPAVVLGKDWGTASLGTTWKLGPNLSRVRSARRYELRRSDRPQCGILSRIMLLEVESAAAWGPNPYRYHFPRVSVGEAHGTADLNFLNNRAHLN
jgi:outer membrane lipase/esterase